MKTMYIPSVPTCGMVNTRKEVDSYRTTLPVMYDSKLVSFTGQREYERACANIVWTEKARAQAQKTRSEIPETTIECFYAGNGAVMTPAQYERMLHAENVEQVNKALTDNDRKSNIEALEVRTKAIQSHIDGMGASAYYKQLASVKALPVEDRQQARAQIAQARLEELEALEADTKNLLKKAQAELAKSDTIARAIRAGVKTGLDRAQAKQHRDELKAPALEAVKKLSSKLEELVTLIYWQRVDVIGYTTSIATLLEQISTAQAKSQYNTSGQLQDTLQQVVAGCARHAVNSRYIARHSAQIKNEKILAGKVKQEDMPTNAGGDSEIKAVLDQFSQKPMGEKAENLIQAAHIAILEAYANGEEENLFVIGMRGVWQAMDKERTQRKDKATGKVSNVLFVPAQWQDETGVWHDMREEAQVKATGTHVERRTEDKALSAIRTNERLDTIRNYADLIRKNKSAFIAVNALLRGKSLRTLATETGKTHKAYTNSLNRLIKNFRKLDNIDFANTGKAGHRERDILDFLDMVQAL